MDRAIFERMLSAVESKDNGELERRVRDNEKELAALKVKASVWGLVGGAIPAVVVLAVIIIKGCA